MQGFKGYLTSLDVSDYTQVREDFNHEMLRQNFGSLDSTFWCLFSAISGGRDWSDAADPLIEIGPMYRIVFAVYVGFTVFALLNILNGIFVDAAMQSEAMKREILVEGALSDMKGMIENIVSLFLDAREFDPESALAKTGMVRKDDFTKFFVSEERVKAYFMSLDLDLESVCSIFDMVDEEKKGEVPLPRLVEGCVSCRGSAKSHHIRTMQEQVSEGLQNMETQMKRLEKRVLARLERMLEFENNHHD
jgi:hypothetical protein